MTGPFMWLSFCDISRPVGTQFLGACLVRADNMMDAVIIAHALGINPGGQVLGVGPIVEWTVPARWIERLLSRDECDEMDQEMLS